MTVRIVISSVALGCLHPVKQTKYHQYDCNSNDDGFILCVDVCVESMHIYMQDYNRMQARDNANYVPEVSAYSPSDA